MPRRAGLPISGIGGITTWRDAAEFIALGAGNVQVCTAAMTYGFKIVQEMISGLSQFHGREGLSSIEDFRGRAVPERVGLAVSQPQLCHQGAIDQDLCIKCGRCHIVCEDTSHQAISPMEDGERNFEVIDDGVRRLQSLRAGLPGRGLHHAGAQDRGRRSAHRLAYSQPPAQLDAASEQSGGGKAAE